MTAPLYERIGGEMAITAASALFYDKVLNDPLTKPFFDGVDVDAQSRKMVAFMAWAFGGPKEFKGRDLTAAHANLVKDHGLSDVHFDAVAMHLTYTLEELGVEKSMVEEAVGIVATTRNAVLGRKA